jgi:hypothetical protein
MDDYTLLKTELKRIAHLRASFSPYDLFANDTISIEDAELSAIETDIMTQLTELRIALQDEYAAASSSNSDAASDHSTRSSRKLAKPRGIKSRR